MMMMFPRWRVVTLRDNVIVAERTFQEEEIAREYVNTVKHDVGEYGYITGR